MTKVTYEEKITTLERYIAKPMAVTDPTVLQAIKQDVIKASSNPGRTANKRGSKGSALAVTPAHDPSQATLDSIYIEGGEEAAPPLNEGNPSAAPPPKAALNALYNTCMGVYREFLKGRNSYLDMSGPKAKWNSDAMRAIIEFMRGFMKSSGKPYGDEEIVKGMKFLFDQDNWNRLNDFHRNRIKLPDIQKNIEEILPMIRNGHDKKSAAKTNLQSFKSRLTKG